MEITRRPLDWFKTKPQARESLGDEAELRQLGLSIKARQLSAVGAHVSGLLFYGHRRLRAAELVGLPDLEVKVFDEILTEGQIRVIQLEENVHRADLTPYEKWRALEELKRLHPKLMAKDLAEMLHLDPSHICRLLSPGKLGVAWQEAFKAGRVGISDCYAASKVSDQQSHELLRLKLEEGANRETLEKAVRKARPKGVDPVSSSTVTIPMNGVKVTIKGKRMNLAQVLECLNECVDAAKKGVKDRLTVKSWTAVLKDKSREVASV
jgi:ParB family transcriptional regulator, chromosome partitioning protein